jgi:methionine salvage enolase-phosphatase E1
MTAHYAVVADIEGTASSIAFVKDTLFPFAKKHLTDYVSQNLGAIGRTGNRGAESGRGGSSR